MEDLLTTRQLESLLQVDRITIYRMLDDGRLRGFKIGGQWRFSRADVLARLQQQGADLAIPAPHPAAEAPAVTDPLPVPCIQAIQSVFAEALGIGAVTVDLEGVPLTAPSNSCRFCDLVLTSEKGRARCAAAWRTAERGALRPCHAGLQCGGATVTVEGRPVAGAVGCQFALSGADGADEWRAGVPRLAEDLGLDTAELEAAAGAVPALPAAEAPRVARLLRSVADTFAEIGRERQRLLSRLQRIAEITALQD